MPPFLVLNPRSDPGFVAWAQRLVVGDLRRVHRSGLTACQYRAAEWRQKAIERAAHELLQVLDKKAGIG